eukprot:12997908-Ditylum_brightwellii.AAC.1
MEFCDWNNSEFSDNDDEHEETKDEEEIKDKHGVTHTENDDSVAEDMNDKDYNPAKNCNSEQN